MRAGIIIEKEAAGGVGTTADGSARAFDEELGSGASEGGKEPVQATFAGDELERPDPFVGDELIVTFRDAEDFVDRLSPGSGEGLIVHEGSEDGAERFAKTEDAEENGIHGLRFGREKRTETGGTILGDQASINKERDELVPGEIAGGGREVGEIKGETTCDEVRFGVGEGRRHDRRLEFGR